MEVNLVTNRREFGYPFGVGPTAPRLPIGVTPPLFAEPFRSVVPVEPEYAPRSFTLTQAHRSGLRLSLTTDFLRRPHAAYRRVFRHHDLQRSVTAGHPPVTVFLRPLFGSEKKLPIVPSLVDAPGSPSRAPPTNSIRFVIVRVLDYLAGAPPWFLSFLVSFTLLPRDQPIPRAARPRAWTSLPFSGIVLLVLSSACFYAGFTGISI